MKALQKTMIIMLVTLVILISYTISGTGSDIKGSLSPPDEGVGEQIPEEKDLQDPPDEPDTPSGPATPSFSTATTYYVLEIIIKGNGTVQINPDQPSYPAGTVIVLTAMADPGWRFDHWSEDLTASSDNRYTIIMDRDKTVTIYFVEVNDASYTSSNPNSPDTPPSLANEPVIASPQTVLPLLLNKFEYWFFEETPSGQLQITINYELTTKESLVVIVTDGDRFIDGATVECLGTMQTTDHGYATLDICFEKTGDYPITATKDQYISAEVEIHRNVYAGKTLLDTPLPEPPTTAGGPGGAQGGGIVIGGGH